MVLFLGSYPIIDLSMLCKDRKIIFITYPFMKELFGAPLLAGCSANGCVKRVNGRCDEPA